MKYNFDQISNRRNTNSIKWDVKENELPMWVADMDFIVLPEINEAIKKAADIGSFGYTYPTDNYFEAYQGWWKRRHQLDIKTEEMVYVSGVISALDSLINHLTDKGDAILIFDPSYNGFYNVIKNNARQIVTSSLIYRNDEWVIDYQDVENKIINHKIKATIFCNPHNPTGKIWSKDEIEKYYNLCKKHNVLFISDEIHCDIVDPNFKYTPALKISEDVLTCVAPSKVFNLAGLQSAMVFIKNPELRKTMQEAFYHDDIGEPNYFVEPATVAAYTKGEQYVDELNAYLFDNKEYVKCFFEKELPHLKLTSGHGTYLLWIDISYYQVSSDIFAKRLREETGLFISDGLIYGESGANFIRMNVATSLENVKIALQKLKTFINSLK